jgi:hypothetical protein
MMIFTSAGIDIFCHIADLLDKVSMAKEKDL